MSNILVLDDDRYFLQRMTICLESFGYSVETLIEPQYLFQLLEVHLSDLILLDIHMPGTDGVAVLQQLKTHAEYQSIPVIMLTADIDNQTLSKCFEAGAIDFINKGIDESILKARVKSALKTREYFKQLQQEITERKKIEETLKLAKEQAESSNQAKSQFLANMSHEMRNPLNNILPLSEFLLKNSDGNLTSGDLDCIQAIYDAGKELHLLIKDLLDFSSIEAGRVEVLKEEVVLNALSQNLTRDFQHLVEEKGLTWHVQIAPDLSPTIISDEQKIRQILKNFVSNALKFTHQGSIQVHFYPIHAKAGGIKKRVALEISDTGIGIPLEKQTSIFDVFQQGDVTIQKKYGGFGLGLAIVKNLTFLLKGKIQLQSEEGKGSTFTLLLPETLLDKSTDREKIQKQLPRSQRDKDLYSDPQISEVLADKKILIVDDEIRNIFTLKSILQQHKASILIGRNGREALEQLEQHPNIQLIIMDIVMPEMDGFEAIQNIRRQKNTHHIPIIILSARTQPLECSKCLNMGANEFLTKPLDVKKLFKILRKYL